MAESKTWTEYNYRLDVGLSPTVQGAAVATYEAAEENAKAAQSQLLSLFQIQADYSILCRENTMSTGDWGPCDVS